MHILLLNASGGKNVQYNSFHPYQKVHAAKPTCYNSIWTTGDQQDLQLVLFSVSFWTMLWNLCARRVNKMKRNIDNMGLFMEFTFTVAHISVQYLLHKSCNKATFYESSLAARLNAWFSTSCKRKYTYYFTEYRNHGMYNTWNIWLSDLGCQNGPPDGLHSAQLRTC
jgi:hypothetical protein